MKKILLGLFGLIGLGLINFSSSYSYTYTGTIDWSTTNRSKQTWLALPLPISPDRLYTTDYLSITCNLSNVSVSNSSLNQLVLYKGYFSPSDLTISNSFGDYVSISSSMTLTYVGVVDQGYQFGIRSNSSYSTNMYFDYSCVVSSDGLIGSTCPTCPTIDQNYCTSNNLCPSSGNSCSPSGSCTVNDKLSENLLYTGSVSLNNSSYTNIFNYGNNGAGTYCVKLSSSSPQILTFGFTNSSTGTPTNLYQLYNDQYGNWVCLYGNKAYFNAKLNSSSNTVSYEVYKLTDLLSDDIPCTNGSSCDYSDYILLSNVTESYCTNRYSDLINESDITSGYCETEFGLIDPENCPASGGTGDVNWSSFFVNSHQIQGANNVYLWLPDFLNWDYTYIDSGSTLEINVENEGDPEYIENMLAIQTYRPTSDEFALSFFGGLYLLFPYIFIVLLVLFIWRLIKRIFK